MSTVKAALIQMELKADPIGDSFDTIRDKMTEAHMVLIEDAAKQGVQVIGLQEVWTMPYFPAEIDERWFGTAEVIPDGPTTQLMMETAKRLMNLGADPSRIRVTGSLKFDSLEEPPVPGRGRDRVLRFFRTSPGRPVIVAGSTLKGEEEAVLRAFHRVRVAGNRALLIIAPRHPQRFGDVVRLCRHEGLSTVRRTELPIDGEPRADAVVLDSIGELPQVYQIATAVFVGGSLVPWGGHNILEPALFGRPIVFGPYMENFAEIAELFLSNRAALQIPSAGALEPTLSSLLGDSVQRAALGAAARALVEANRGATQRSLTVIAELLPPVATGPAGVVVPFSAR